MKGNITEREGTKERREKEKKIVKMMNGFCTSFIE